MHDRLLSTGRAAELLGSSRQHIVDMCERGELAYVWVGRHRRIPVAEINRLVQPALTRDQERSLWLHRAVAGRLVVDPDRALAKARQNTEKLAIQHRDTRAGSYLDRWRALIDSGADAVLDVLTSVSPEALELRQNSPFAGVLEEQERQACLRAFTAHWRREHAA